jgi:hypothetical protein
VLPEAAVAEVRKNLAAKLPEAAPLFEEFVRTVPLQIQRPTSHDRERASDLADAKDVPILAAAIGAGARLLVTHNVRHFGSGQGVRARQRQQSNHGARDADLVSFPPRQGDRRDAELLCELTCVIPDVPPALDPTARRPPPLRFYSQARGRPAPVKCVRHWFSSGGELAVRPTDASFRAVSLTARGRARRSCHGIAPRRLAGGTVPPAATGAVHA